MRAEEVLREPERLEGKILALVGEIDRLRLALLPGGIDYSLDRVQGGGGHDKYPATMDKIIEKEEKVRQLNARRLWLINERIPYLLSRIQDDLARDVVREWYFTDATMEEVGMHQHVSYATAYRYRYMGVGDIQKALDEES